MRSSFQQLLAYSCLCLQAVSAVPVAPGDVVSPAAEKRDTSCSSLDEPIAPKEDPWYTAPFEFEKEKPGTILRIRPAVGNLTTITGNCSEAYNILYRTTNSLYKPTWAVTTFFVPQTKAAALLSYQIPYDSADLNASPSYAMYSGGLSDVSDSLGNGWYVSVPDYEGPNASFTAGVLSGHATIDSVRAILSASDRFQLSPDIKYAMWGYSGGALASEWAAELQVQYAPELNFSGAALGGLTPNVTSVLETIYNSAEAGLVPPAILGISNQHPELYELLLTKLKTDGPYNKTGFLATLNNTLAENIVAFAFKDMTNYFDDGLTDIINSETMSLIYNDGIMGYHGVPQFPIYAYKAIQDAISPISDTDSLINRFCGIGVNIVYNRNTNGGHAAEAINGRDKAYEWLQAVLGGAYATKYPTTGCAINDYTVNITSSAF